MRVVIAATLRYNRYLILGLDERLSHALSVHSKEAEARNCLT